MRKRAIRPLRSEAEYQAALAEIEHYFAREPEPGSPEADRFELLALVIDDYEDKHWPIDPPDPLDAIKFQMEMRGYSQADLGRTLGSRQRASDILRGKRPLTIQMVWKLYREWGIPAESLIRPRALSRGHVRRPATRRAGKTAA
jgi:HTH-type transcriptional regulator/antitoxin HigA